jgi:hypothetical protein
VRVLGPGGVVTATFSADLFKVTVSGGLLVGLTGQAGQLPDVTPDYSAVAAYRLSDGRLEWRHAVPAKVADIAFAGGEAVIIDQSGPDYLMRGINLATGHMRSLGHIPPEDLNVSHSGLCTVAGRYVIMNQEDAASVAAFAVP